MALIVEDGTGIAGANTYADLTDIRAYASDRGVTLSTDDVALEADVHKAMDHLEGLRARYQGWKTVATNALQFPRESVKIDCVALANDAIPVELINAECQLVIEQHNGVDLAPTRTEAFIIEDTTGPLTTKYSDKHGGGPGSVPDMITVDNLLAPLFSTCGQSRALRTIRV